MGCGIKNRKVGRWLAVCSVHLMGVLVFVIISGCSPSSSLPLGSRKNPIKFYFTPSIDAQEVSTKAEVFTRLLERETGYTIVSAVPLSYVVLVETFGTNRCDVACMNSFGYLLANQKFGARARLRVLRNGESTYRGEIIARVDSGINNIRDIDKKKFAFTDPSSTSGYLLPLNMFKAKNISLAERVFAMRHDNVVVMVYQKKVDAGACYYAPPGKDGKLTDARARVMTQFPDVAEKIKIIELTDEIPNDPIVFRKGLPTEIEEKIVDGIVRIMDTEEGKKAFSSIYSVNGVSPVSDSNYDVLRRLLASTGVTVESLVKK